jgi:hypothetical protein
MSERRERLSNGGLLRFTPTRSAFAPLRSAAADRPPRKGEATRWNDRLYAVNAVHLNFSNAFARWLMECFSVGSISPKVSRMPSIAKIGS